MVPLACGRKGPLQYFKRTLFITLATDIRIVVVELKDPQFGVERIIENLADNLSKFEDFDNPNYYNIQVFKRLKEEEK